MLRRLLAVATVFMNFLCLPAYAAPITETFRVTVSDGPFAGAIGTGTITYDPTLATDISALGFPCPVCVGPNQGLEIELTVFGQTFSEADGDVPAIFPWLGLASGEEFVTFAIQETQFFFPGQISPNPRPIDEPGVVALWLFSPLRPGSEDLDYDLGLRVGFEPVAESVPIPVPALALMCGATVTTAWRTGTGRSKRAAHGT